MHVIIAVTYIGTPNFHTTSVRFGTSIRSRSRVVHLNRDQKWGDQTMTCAVSTSFISIYYFTPLKWA